MPTTPSTEPAWKLCQNSIRKNLHTPLLWASSQDYTDMWVRDTFFASWGIDSTTLRPLLACIARFQRKDGLVPLYIGRGNACCKMFCRARPSGPIQAVYGDVKTGDCPTDSCFQFIIMAHDIYPEQCKKAWNFMQTKVKDGLIYENGLGTWQDTIKHKGHVAYTNILYYKATLLLFPERAKNILSHLVNKLWSGQYFYASTSNTSFGHVDNSLAILYNIAPKTNTILKQLSKHTWTSPPNVRLQSFEAPFKWYEVYLPCYPIGNSDYHQRWAWSWVHLLVKKALKHTDLQTIDAKIREHGSLFETYDENGPICRLLYKSQPNFSEACGMYLDIVNKKINSNLAW